MLRVKVRTMDFKGISWAGNIYQKFETMCLEVEEVMYQDTVKYMENQVQKVGGSVKKFYSEVMQDLLPLSCVHTDTDKKPTAILDSQSDILKTKDNEDDMIFDMKAEKDSPRNPSYSIKSLAKVSPGVLVHDKRSEVCSGRTKKSGLVGIKRISQNNRVSKDSLPKSSLSGNISKKHLSCDTGATSSAFKTKSDDAVVLSSNSAVRWDHEEPVKDHVSTSEAPGKAPSPEKISPAESLRQKKDDSKYVMTASDNNTSDDLVVRPIERASDHTSSCILRPMELSNGSRVVNDTLNVVSENNEVAMPSNEDDKFDMELIGSEEATEDPGEVISELIETAKLDESCVFIEGNAFIQYVPEGTMKHKSSYKKKIHKAFLSKLRSSKKQPHQFVSEFEDLGGKKNEETVKPPVLDMMSSENRKLSSVGSSHESDDWELL